MVRSIRMILLVICSSTAIGCASPWLQPPKEEIRAMTIDRETNPKEVGVASVNQRETDARRIEQFKREGSIPWSHGAVVADPPGFGEKLVENLIVTPAMYATSFLFLITGQGMILL